MSRVADVLGLVRIGAALLFPCCATDGSWACVALFTVAAGTDYVDGPLARRAGTPSLHGALLDGGADVAFVGIASATGAARGIVPWIAPAAIVAAGTAYLAASWHRSRVRGRAERAYSRVGHAAGVLNYALAGFVAGQIALPTVPWRPLLLVASALVVALNGWALAVRLRPAPRAGASPA